MTIENRYIDIDMHKTSLKEFLESFRLKKNPYPTDQYLN